MGLKKNPQEKLKLNQLVLKLIGNFVFSKGLQLNFAICYLISRTEALNPPASSIFAVRLAKMQLKEMDVLTRKHY